MGGFARTGSRRFSNLRVGRTGRDGRGGTCILCTSSLLVPIRCRTSTGPGHDRMMFHQPSGRGDVERSRPHDPAALRWVAPSSEGTIDQGANGSLDLDYCCKALLGERCFGRSRFRADDRGIGCVRVWGSEVDELPGCTIDARLFGDERRWYSSCRTNIAESCR